MVQTFQTATHQVLYCNEEINLMFLFIACSYCLFFGVSVHTFLYLLCSCVIIHCLQPPFILLFNPLNPELNPICYLLALLGAHHFLHVTRIRVKLLTFRLLMSYTYGAPILDVSRSHTTTQHSR